MEAMPTSLDEPSGLDLSDMERIGTLAREIEASASEILKRQDEDDRSGFIARFESSLAYLDRAVGPLSESAPERERLRSALRSMTQSIEEDIAAAEDEVTDLERSSRNLADQIVRKRDDLARAEESLAEMEGVRPACMDEYEALEDELRTLHREYVTRVRNVHYLEREVAKVEMRQAEIAKREEAARRKLRDRLQAEDRAVLLLGGGKVGSGDDDGSRGNGSDWDSVSGGGGELSTVPFHRGESDDPRTDTYVGDEDSTSISSEEDLSGAGASDTTDSSW